MISTQFSLAGAPLDCLRLDCGDELNGTTATAIRAALHKYMQFDFAVFYIDAKDAVDVDLSGINEIIHSQYSLAAANRSLVFVYRQNSPVDKWVSTTGLHQFVSTAVIPA